MSSLSTPYNLEGLTVMKETIVETRLENPKMSTLERLELLDVIINQTVVTAKCDGELSEVVYDRNGESYTINKWGHKRQP